MKGDSKSLEGKVAIVTGAGQGIGFEIARRFVECGAKVIVNDQDPVRCEQAADRIDSVGTKCRFYAGDVREPADMGALIAFAGRKFGGLDIVVANAGLTLEKPFLDTEPSDLEAMLQVNLMGSVFLAQSAAQQMIKQGKGGRILFMSSATGSQAHPNLVCYGMTKAALQMLAKGLVAELAGHGITTNAIAPGAVATERTVHGTSGYEEKWCAKTPTNRVTQNQDVADAAVFLVSEAAAQVTGQTLIVDGGWTSTSPMPDL